MPEGPELHLASRFVNLVCKNRIFTGQVVKSAISTRQVEVDWNEPSYTISAVSRGKEVKLTLTKVDGDQESFSDNKKIKPVLRKMDLLFQFGMSGKFDFYEGAELKKHAHLNFFTKDDPKMVLSFIDYRRFGKWTADADWSTDRGPCVIYEYPEFRRNVLNNLDNSAFNKPICETLLNQKYFNGIGNYLRAEILYRLKIPPFVSARSVLEPLADIDMKDEDKKTSKVKVKQEHGDILQLCNQLPLEVINLGCTAYSPDESDPDFSKFTEWLQCYYNPNMKNMADHNKRTIWFDGIPGPMAPKEGKARRMKPILKNKKTKDGTKGSQPAENKKSPKRTGKAGAKRVTRSVLKKEEVTDQIETKTRKRKLKVQVKADVEKEVPIKQKKTTKRTAKQNIAQAESTETKIKENGMKRTRRNTRTR